MVDDELARELEALLAVEPAADFRTRVIERIAADAIRHRHRAAWAIAAGVLLAVAVGAWVLRHRDPMATAPPLLASHRVTAAAHDAPRQLVRVLPPQPEPRVARHPALPVRVFSPLDVIVDAREAAAWRQTLARVRSGTVDLSRLARSLPSVPPAADEEFLLPMVVIEPLPADPREQGVHQ